MKIFSILLVVILSVKSCGDTSNSNTANAEKLFGEFHISTLDQNTDLPETLTLKFDKDTKTVSGFAGCNNFFGSFTAENGSLTFSKMGSTRKMCFGDANKIEAKTLELLSKINTFSFEDNVLILKESENILIKAKK